MVNLKRKNGTAELTLEDVHKKGSDRHIALNLVGISDIQYPVVIRDWAGYRQHTIAKLSLGVDLPEEVKGAHMSRCVEILGSHSGEVGMSELPKMLESVRERLDSEHAELRIDFPYFMERSAPVTGATALMDYQCSYAGELDGNHAEYTQSVRVPVASLCPCSKAISDYGAHNQRGYVEIDIKKDRPGDEVWLADLIEIAERSGSAPVYPVLKRPDERFVTMQAYENPAFVEDIVRESAWQLTQDERIVWFRVKTTNHESIHNHNVFGSVEWNRYG